MGLPLSLRTSQQQLPAVTEFHQTCESEFSYPTNKEKAGKHYPDFEVVVDWVKALGISSEIFTREISPPKNGKGFYLESDKDLIWGKENQEAVVSKTLAKNTEIDTEEVLKSVTRYLNLEDHFEKADVGIVYGGNKKNPTRPTKAMEIYKAGKVSRLLFTGRGPVWKLEDEDKRTEARAYADFVINRGVNLSDILLEEDAITMADNGRRSLGLLDRLGIKPRSIVIVTSWYCMRRAVGMLWKHMSAEAKIYSAPAIPAEGSFTLNSWYKNPDGIRTVFNEFVKMRMAVDLDSA